MFHGHRIHTAEIVERHGRIHTRSGIWAGHGAAACIDMDGIEEEIKPGVLASEAVAGPEIILCIRMFLGARRGTLAWTCTFLRRHGRFLCPLEKTTTPDTHEGCWGGRAAEQSERGSRPTQSTPARPIACFRLHQPMCALLKTHVSWPVFPKKKNVSWPVHTCGQKYYIKLFWLRLSKKNCFDFVLKGKIKMFWLENEHRESPMVHDLSFPPSHPNTQRCRYRNSYANGRDCPMSKSTYHSKTWKIQFYAPILSNVQICLQSSFICLNFSDYLLSIAT